MQTSATFQIGPKIKFGNGINIRVLEKFSINWVPNKTIEYNKLDIIIRILQSNAI